MRDLGIAGGLLLAIPLLAAMTVILAVYCNG